MADELSRIQARFHALVTAREPVPEAMQRLGVSEEEIARDFAGDGRASAVERLSVYANMYSVRLHDVFAEFFPRLRAVLGDAAFHGLVTHYLETFPPSHPSIGRAGAKFPSFVAGHHGDPRLGELGLFEWTLVDLVSAPDAEPLRHEHVRALPPSALPELTLALVPAVRVLRLTHPVDDEAAEGNALPSPTIVIAWRNGVTVHHRRATVVEAEALAFCARGPCELADLCEHLADLLGEDAATVQAFELVSRWLGDGFLRQDSRRE